MWRCHPGLMFLDLFWHTIFLFLTNPTTSRYRALRWELCVLHRMLTCTWRWELHLFFFSWFFCVCTSCSGMACYIDNILLIWTGPVALLDDLPSFRNVNTFYMSFTMVADSHQLPFLDFLILIDWNSWSLASLYRTSTQVIAFYMPKVNTLGIQLTRFRLGNIFGYVGIAAIFPPSDMRQPV